jgi:O-antigen/teichoic acid export membrane protein
LSTRRSLVFSFIDRYASLAIGIASSMIIARLLTPAEIGIFSVAMVLIALVSTVRDMGAGQYLVQEKELTQDRIRAVWAVQLGLGALLAVVVLGLSQPAAAFYAEPRVQGIMWLLALNYLVNPLGSVTYAWLMREMRYDAIAVIRLSATLGSATTSVVLALRGHGPISLAWGSLAGTLCNAGVSVFFRPRGYPWMPGLREIRRVLSFGTKITSGSIASSIATGAPEFLLGKLQSFTAAGLFSRAQGLVAMFDRLVSDAVYPVALSLFSKELRESRDASPGLIKALSYVTALSWSFAIAIVFLAHPIIRLLYGSQWDQAADLARLLAGALAFAAPMKLCHAALIAAGGATTLLRATLMTVGLTLPLVVAGVVAGLFYLGAAMLLAAALGALVWLSATRTLVRFDWRTLAIELGRSLAVALTAGLAPACAFFAWGSRPEHLVLPLATGILGSSIGFLLALHVVRHPLRLELELIGARFVKLCKACGRGFI